MKRDDTEFYLILATFAGMVGVYVLLYKTYQLYQQYQPQIQSVQQQLQTGSALLNQVGNLFGGNKPSNQ